MKLTAISPVLLAAILALSACGRVETRADNKILCSPDKLEAFFLRPGGADITFITRVESADAICRQALKGGGE